MGPRETICLGLHPQPMTLWLPQIHFSQPISLLLSLFRRAALYTVLKDGHLLLIFADFKNNYMLFIMASSDVFVMYPLFSKDDA